MKFYSKKGVLFIRLLSQILSTAYISTIPFGTAGVEVNTDNLESKTEKAIAIEEVNYKGAKNPYQSHEKEIEEEGKIIVADITSVTQKIVEDTSFTKLIIVKDKKEEINYNPDNLRELSNLSVKQIEKILKGSALQTLASDYHEMESKYNINAIFLMALNSEESGHGKSSLAINNNNIGGVKSGTGGWSTFESWTHSLDYISSLIDEHYLTETGIYYNGTSIYDVNVRYCEGTQWAKNLNEIAYEFLDKVEDENAPRLAKVSNY